MARSKIICTIGPASRDEHVLKGLINAGMDCARLNFAHGSYEEHEQVIESIRSIDDSIAIIQDLPSVKLRIGEIADGYTILKKGSIISLVEDDIIGNDKVIPIEYKGLYKHVDEKDEIYLSDGSIKLEVIDIKGKDIVCKVKNDGKLYSRKGLNIPRLRDRLDAFTDKDKEHLRFGLKHGIDMVALSFVKDAKDIAKVKEFASVYVLAKIERREAIENIEGIIKEADGIIVARGDLGVEYSIEQVPMLQKRIIYLCNKHAKPVITATQLLESMVNNPTPTRAEVTDIANAILDGTDALLLSEETAIGRYPIECVKILDKVARNAEDMLKVRRVDENNFNVIDSISKAIVQISYDMNANAIISDPKLALAISRFRPNSKIYAFTNYINEYRFLRIVWNVTPIMVHSDDKQSMIGECINYISEYSRIIIAYADDKVTISVKFK